MLRRNCAFRFTQFEDLRLRSRRVASGVGVHSPGFRNRIVEMKGIIPKLGFKSRVSKFQDLGCRVLGMGKALLDL